MNVDMENLFYNDWKSRQDVKRREDSYKEHVEKNPNARLVDELLNKVKFNLLNTKLNKYINEE
jgi:hypothetical protein